MSEKDDVNINDPASKKFSADKKIYNIDLNAAKTETRSPGNNEAGAEDEGADPETVRSASTNNLNKESAAFDVNINTGKLSNEATEKDTQKGQYQDQDEKRASDEKLQGTSGAGVTDQSLAGNSESKTSDEDPNKVDRQVVAASGGAESVDIKSGWPEVKMDIACESLQELKMNIAMDGPASPSQSHIGTSASQCLQGGDHNESKTDGGAEDKNKENVSGKKEELSKEKDEHDTVHIDEPIEVDPPRNETDGRTCKNEGDKSDSENEVIDSTDTDYPMDSAPEDSQLEEGDKESNVNRNADTVSDVGKGSRQKDNDNENLEAGASSRDSTARNPRRRNTDEVHNVKPSDVAPSRLARLKRQWSDRDLQMYRAGYPGKQDDPELAPLNLHFYQGRIKCLPNGSFIDDIHDSWWEDHDLLEVHHGYIQWLFPIREQGMNHSAQELQICEAKALKADKQAMERFVKSYKMMLNFYGFHLISDETGEVERADNWQERFEHLNFSMHNYLRITRILKCLGELGLEKFKAPFLRLVLEEAILTRELSNTLESCINYWVGTVKDDAERASIMDYAENLHRMEEERV